MLLHQRIDYNAPTPGQNIYLRIPKSSTLWTTIECSDSQKSLSFPSRIVDSEKKFCTVFSGVDNSGFLRRGLGLEYRVHWRIVADPDDPYPTSDRLVSLPLGKEITFTFSHGNSILLSLTMGGVDIVLLFDLPTRTLVTSWFTPPFTASWSLEGPRKLLSRIMSGRNIFSIKDTDIKFPPLPHPLVEGEPFTQEEEVRSTPKESFIDRTSCWNIFCCKV